MKIGPILAGEFLGHKQKSYGNFELCRTASLTRGYASFELAPTTTAAPIPKIDRGFIYCGTKLTLLGDESPWCAFL
jgi:hypothetical protein